MFLLATMLQYSDLFWGLVVVTVVAMVCATAVYFHHSKARQGEQDARRRDEWMNRPLETFGQGSGAGASSGPDLDDIEDRYLTPEERARKREREARGRARGAGGWQAGGPGYGGQGYGGPDGWGGAGEPWPRSRKSKGAAFLLCFFLGGFGAHYFYCGRFGMGLLYLLTGGLFGLGTIVDVFRIALDRFPDGQGRYL